MSGVPCSAVIDPACLIGPGGVSSAVGAAVNAAADDALSGIAGSIQNGIAWIITNSTDWWVKRPSPDLAAEPAVSRLQQDMLPVAVAVAVFAMIIAGGKMAISRKGNPLVDVGSGLVTIAATSAVGVLLPTLLLKAGDAWSDWVLGASVGGQFATRLTALLTLHGAAPGVVLVLGTIAIIMSTIQAVLMLFRQGALVILAGMLPLAAAGTLTPATRPWFRKVTGWMLALIAYKPAAAAVYATAFTLIGNGTGTQASLTGFAMLLMSLLALPVLLRFFTWTAGTVDGGGGGFLQTALSGAVAIGSLRGSVGGAGPVQQARALTSQLGPQAGNGAGTVPVPVGAATTAAGTRASAAPAGTGATSAGTAAAGAAAGSAGLAAAGLAPAAGVAARAAGNTMQPPGSGRRG